jgi:hypothetical protein
MRDNMNNIIFRVKLLAAMGLVLTGLVACGGGGGGKEGNENGSDNASLSSSAGQSATSANTGNTGYTLLAWNDLGMHCVDGKDYSVFSILPPFNNLHAQLIRPNQGGLITSGVTLTYEALADATGSINTTSVGKTNFWSWVTSLFGATLNTDVGLKGNATPSTTARPMSYNTTNKWFEAEGIPVTPMDDRGVQNFYPMVKVVAKNTAGTVLATARTVLPVSDEMSCKSCHASTTTSPDAKPAAGWVMDSNLEKDWKRNILRLHDERKLSTPAFTAALTKLGYNAAGLSATAQGGQPILCAACHSSNALPGTGIAGISPLTQALHTLHARVKDPVTQLSLDSSTNRTSCYLCHPGSATQCLRGPMGNALDASGKPAMNCQSCHGSMSVVGNSARTGWLNQPTCQSCHHDGQRDLSAVDATGKLKVWSDQRFASTINTPATGFNLYRFSAGHGGLQCESCHGATHAEYPSSHANDNVLSQDVQGHAGTIGECTACHSTVPNTASGGPHGMHTTTANWISSHRSAARSSGTAACAYCHGANYRGAPLSQVKMAKSFIVNGRVKNYAAGQSVGCYDCHNGPGGG